MTVVRLILREILYRKGSFALAVAAVVAAVGVLVAEMTLLRAHDLRTEEVLAAKEDQTQERMQQLEDDYRKIGVNMGFNLLILPKDQNLSDLFADDYASKYMPEEYAHKLAAARVATINHLLPSLQQKVKWPEVERTIILMGVRGEVLIHGGKQKPILEAVTPGTMVIGHELHRSLGLKVGQKVRLLGRDFTVAKLHPERGNKDDITVWINLKEAQELLDKPGLINAMLALECNCSADRLALIRGEIGGILPDTQIIEFATQAVARAEARNRAAAAAADAMEHEKEHQDRLRSRREREALSLVFLLLAGCIIWLQLLTFLNVRERRGEIAVLRALGVRSRQILGLVLGKAVLVGVIGGALGYVLGFAIALARQDGLAAAQLFEPRWLLTALLGAPLLTALASGLEAHRAARQDPAEILREE